MKRLATESVKTAFRKITDPGHLELLEKGSVAEVAEVFTRGELGATGYSAENYKGLGEGWTPLLIALRSGNIPVAQLLLDMGAEVHALTAQDHICCLHALAYGVRESDVRGACSKEAVHAIAAELLKKEPDLELMLNKSGNTALHLAADLASVELVDALMRLSPALREELNRSGWTPLKCAALSSADPDLVCSCIRRMVEIGGPGILATQDKAGRAVLHLAIMTPLAQYEPIATLVELGADVFLADKAGQTPYSLLEQRLSRAKAPLEVDSRCRMLFESILKERDSESRRLREELLRAEANEAALGEERKQKAKTKRRQRRSKRARQKLKRRQAAMQEAAMQGGSPQRPAHLSDALVQSYLDSPASSVATDASLSPTSLSLPASGAPPRSPPVLSIGESENAHSRQSAVLHGGEGGGEGDGKGGGEGGGRSGSGLPVFESVMHGESRPARPGANVRERAAGPLEGNLVEPNDEARLVELFPTAELLHVYSRHLIPLREGAVKQAAHNFSSAQLELMEKIHKDALDQISRIRLEQVRLQEQHRLQEALKINEMKQRVLRGGHLE